MRIYKNRARNTIWILEWCWLKILEPCVAAVKGMEDVVDAGSVYEIHFRFQPKKKFFVSFVRSTALDFFQYDIQENVDYFPVIQGQKNATATLFKPRED